MYKLVVLPFAIDLSINEWVFNLQPRYMGLLIKQAERRKREDERRKERQIQKEREAEGDQFADKEVFITSSYKKKLEEIRKMDEDDKRMERLEGNYVFFSPFIL